MTTALEALRDRFVRQVKHRNGQREDDVYLAGLAKSILAERAGCDELISPSYSRATIIQVEQMAREAMLLLDLWSGRDFSHPKTFRVIIDALLVGWARTHSQELEQNLAEVLLNLGVLKGDEKEGEKGQLEESLRICAKEWLNYQPKKLLRLLDLTTDETSMQMPNWAFRTLTLKGTPAGTLFAGGCLLACDDADPTLLKEAATHHIKRAAQTLAIVKKKLRFEEPRGGPWKPMGEKIAIRTDSQVDVRWVTYSNEADLSECAQAKEKWLICAENQVLDALGMAHERGFNVDLIVDIYPHVENWFARRHELTPLSTVSRSV